MMGMDNEDCFEIIIKRNPHCDFGKREYSFSLRGKETSINDEIYVTVSDMAY